MKDPDYTIEINTTARRKIAVGIVALVVPFIFGYVLHFYISNSQTHNYAQETSVLELKGVVDSVNQLDGFLIDSHSTIYTHDSYKIRIYFKEETVVEEMSFLEDWGIEYPDNRIQPKTVRDIQAGSRVYIKYKPEGDRFTATYIRIGNNSKIDASDIQI